MLNELYKTATNLGIFFAIHGDGESHRWRKIRDDGFDGFVSQCLPSFALSGYFRMGFHRS